MTEAEERLLATLEKGFELGLRIIRCYQAMEQERVSGHGDPAELLDEGEVPIDNEEPRD